MRGEQSECDEARGCHKGKKKKTAWRNWEIFSVRGREKVWRKCDHLFHVLECMSWMYLIYSVLLQGIEPEPRVLSIITQIHYKKGLKLELFKNTYRWPREKMIISSSELLKQRLPNHKCWKAATRASGCSSGLVSATYWLGGHGEGALWLCVAAPTHKSSCGRKVMHGNNSESISISYPYHLGTLQRDFGKE